jgi:cystathionine beta-synthase
VGGSSGSALSGAIRYLHTAARDIAQDPTANVVVILPDGVRNYMSKPWFLETAQTPEGEGLRGTIKRALGRDLGDVSVISQQETKPDNGGELEAGVGKAKISHVEDLSKLVMT